MRKHLLIITLALAVVSTACVGEQKPAAAAGAETIPPTVATSTTTTTTTLPPTTTSTTTLSATPTEVVLKSFLYEGSTATVGIKKIIHDTINDIQLAVVIGEYRGETTVDLPGLGEVRMPMFWLGEVSPDGEEVVEGLLPSITDADQKISVVEFGNVLWIDEAQGLVDVDKIKGTVFYTSEPIDEVLDGLQETGPALYAMHIWLDLMLNPPQDCGDACQQIFASFDYGRALVNGEERVGYGYLAEIFIPGHYQVAQATE